MKKNVHPARLTLILAGILVLGSILFTACKKDNDGIGNNTPVAALIGFNLAPDKSAISIAISGNSLTPSPLSYASYTGGYQNIFPGTRQVSSYEYGADSAFATVTQNFAANNYYSVFTLGAKGIYRNVVVNDELDSLSAASGKAFVRYINAIPDSSNPNVTITASGTDVSNGNAPFASVSPFAGINPGDITIKISGGTSISATRTITLEKGKVYTILLVGIPGDPEASKNVQIRYITNGTLQ